MFIMESCLNSRQPWKIVVIVVRDLYFIENPLCLIKTSGYHEKNTNSTLSSRGTPHPNTL